MKKEILITSLVLVAQTLTANFAWAQDKSGSDVGKGGNGGSRSDLYNGVSGRYDLYGICHEATGILRDALDQAHELFNDGDIRGARNMLMQGLREALQSFDPKLQEKPLLQNAIQRGLRLNSVFQNSCPVGDQGCLSLEKRAAIYFLSVYYNYILNTVTSLDENYYIRYVTSYQRHCRSFDCLPEDYGNGFFTNYRDAAITLLGFYNGDGSGLPDALARNTYELRLAELVLRWSADDLNSDLFRRHFACAISELDRASLAIADFNAGNTSRFKTSTRAVQFAREKSENVAYKLGAQNSCIIYPVWKR
ncbi:MAG: hypothetical protein A2Z20_12920 [Bdellovibrionales bacterium RBG_16_40_8]|nr:MAG: hypothetical protein A2Z20_12920 [Bdellovibrionales bacterium RBG_16_40_8]